VCIRCGRAASQTFLCRRRRVADSVRNHAPDPATHHTPTNQPRYWLLYATAVPEAAPVPPARLRALAAALGASSPAGAAASSSLLDKVEVHSFVPAEK